MQKLPEEIFEKKHNDLVDFFEWKFHCLIKHNFYTILSTGKALSRANEEGMGT